MSYIGDPYEYDVFVSYPHAVEALRGDSTLRDWSRKVARNILSLVRMSLAGEPDGEGFEYYLDDREVSAAPLTDTLEEAVRKSAVLVILMSPFYRSWCLKELDWFLDTARSDGRGFRQCVLLEVKQTRDDLWPGQLRDTAGEPLFRKRLTDEAGDPLGYDHFLNTSTLPAMNGLLKDIAIEIRDKLVHERKRREAERALVRSKVYTRPLFGEDAPDNLVIYLQAEPADTPVWSSRRESLKSARAVVLPAEPFEEGMAHRSESMISVYEDCDGLTLHRVRRDDSISPRIRRAFHDRRLLFQKTQKRVRWAVLDELPDEPLGYADAFGIRRVSAQDEDWIEQLIAVMGGTPADAGPAP